MRNIACLILLVSVIYGCTKKEIPISNKNENTVDLVENEETNPALEETMYVNSSEGLRVRKEPDVESERISLLNNKEKVLVIDKDKNEYTIDGIRGNWFLIKTDEITGWVFSGYLVTEIADNDLLDSFGLPIDMDFTPTLNIVHFTDKDIIRNVEIIYKQESDAILNSDEIEPNQNVFDIFDKPFENIELSITHEWSPVFVGSPKWKFIGIQTLFDFFNVTITENLIKKINAIKEYKPMKIAIENIALYIYREGGIAFKLFVVEYTDNFPYEPIIKIGNKKNEIINSLGNPFGYSEERNMILYISHRTLRQIAIFFENDVVKKVQIVSFGGN